MGSKGKRSQGTSEVAPRCLLIVVSGLLDLLETSETEKQSAQSRTEFSTFPSMQKKALRKSATAPSASKTRLEI